MELIMSLLLSLILILNIMLQLLKTVPICSLINLSLRSHSDTGKKILEWTRQGEPKGFNDRINECKSITELLELYRANPKEQKEFQKAFASRRSELTSHEHLMNQNNGKA